MLFNMIFPQLPPLINIKIHVIMCYKKMNSTKNYLKSIHKSMKNKIHPYEFLRFHHSAGDYKIP